MYRRDHGRCLPHAVRVSRRKKITCRTCQTCHSGDGVKTDESLVVFIGRGFVCRKATRSIVFSCTLWRRGTSRCFGVSSRTRCKHLCESRVDLKSRQLVIVQRYGFSPLTRYVRLIFSLNVKRYDFDMSALLFIYLFNKKISLRSQDHLVSFAKFLPRPILLIMKEISLNKPVGSFESRLSSRACRLCLAVFHWQATIMGPVSIFFFPPSALHDSLIAQPWFIAFLYMYISLFFFFSSSCRTTVLIRVACSSWPFTSPQITPSNRQRSVSFFLKRAGLSVWRRKLLNSLRDASMRKWFSALIQRKWISSFRWAWRFVWPSLSGKNQHACVTPGNFLLTYIHHGLKTLD